MSRTSFPTGSLILVCDGGKALLFENAGDDKFLNLKAVGVHVEAHPATQELGADRPTRVYDSMDGSRSGTEETDWHNEAEVAFLRATAKELDAQVQERHAKHVAIVAPPRALGVLREAIGAPTRAVLSAELAKDLVKHPTFEIERQLAALRELK